jgi:hypothetical protein
VEHHTVDGCRFALGLHPLQLLDDLLEAAAQLCIGSQRPGWLPRSPLGLTEAIKSVTSRTRTAEIELSTVVEWPNGGIRDVTPRKGCALSTI